jgi:DNA-binding MarR family transcriptional regulator
LGLTYPQFLVLICLARAGRCSITDLARMTRLDHGTLSPLLRRMADRALITLDRSTADARTVIVALTDRGVALQPTLNDAHCQVRQALGLSPTEMRRLHDTLSHLADRAATR